MPDDYKPKRALLSDTAFDAVKNTAQYVIPGLGTLYFTLASIWGLPHGEQVLGSLLALNLFLAGVLGYSAKSYESSGAAYSGTIRVDEAGPKRIELDAPIEDVVGMKSVKFRVAP